MPYTGRTKELILRDKTDALRARSGRVTSTDPLVNFLYLLTRECCPVGTVEKILGDIEVAAENGEFVFTNGYLANWAKDAAARLTGGY
jgi:hypothetical protein